MAAAPAYAEVSSRRSAGRTSICRGHDRVERGWGDIGGPIEQKSKAGDPAVLRRYLAAHELQAKPREGLVCRGATGGPFIASNVRMRALTAWAGGARGARSEAPDHVPRELVDRDITFDRYEHLMPGNEARPPDCSMPTWAGPKVRRSNAIG